jgi:hypothetical protein
MSLLVTRSIVLIGSVVVLWIVLNAGPLAAAMRPSSKDLASSTKSSQVVTTYPPFTSTVWDVQFSGHGLILPNVTTLDAGGGPVVFRTVTFDAAQGAQASSRLQPQASTIGSRSQNSTLSANVLCEPSHVINKSRTHVEFRALWQHRLRRAGWNPLLIYVFSGPKAWQEARVDFEARQKELGHHSSHTYGRGVEVETGVEIDIVPELPGVVFNPRRITLQWLEPWHRAEFRMQATDDNILSRTGRVAFYVGPVLIGETPISVSLDNDGNNGDDDHEITAESATFPYACIFASYSHEDKEIVAALERAYQVIGMTYLRDVRILRSGERWSSVLLRRIEEADIFQLYWSDAAKRSKYVRREWVHAVALRRGNFIRPVYWQKPMPACPPALRHIHFACLADELV